VSAPDFLAIAARRVCGLPAEWQPRIYRSLDSVGFELIGAEPIGTYTRGPKKGKPKFPPRKEMRSVFVTHDHIRQARHSWERETGLCSHCGGSGQLPSIISIHGNTYKPCHWCNATGRVQP
jgi:hypothetical protein